MTRSTIRENNRIHRLLTYVGVTVFWLGIWQIISLVVAQELLVPAPSVVAVTLWHLMGTAAFWKTTGLSLLRITAGFLVSVIAGSVIAVLTTRYRLADTLLTPVLRIVRAAPIASFIILALVWVKTESLPSFISFFMVVPVIWANVEKGIRQTDAGLLELAQVYRFNRLKTLMHIRIPSIMPYFLAACTTGIGFAWKSGIAAEVICRPEFSIGRQMQEAKNYLETPEVIAWTITVVVLSMLLENGLVAAVRHSRWRNAGSAD